VLQQIPPERFSKDVWMLGIGLGLVADGLTATDHNRT